MEQPRINTTRSSFQYFKISFGSSTMDPLFQTLYRGTSVLISISPRSFKTGSPFGPNPIKGQGLGFF